ncbi:MAG: fructose bisphosphate aldolase [Rhodospirillales bacterium]|nr:fructose bisphosphate aldolase [Acetobacter sp.]
MNNSKTNSEQFSKMQASPGFVAALDQSGGSTPKALAAYGIKEDAWSDEEGMYALVHQMRTRIITSPSFTGQRILGAILFENTMDRNIEGRPSADYLWEVKEIVPFLKIDNGLAAEQDGVQLMKPMPQLADLLAKAKAKHIFGTKMRSFIKAANEAGIQAIVDQQFRVAEQISAQGLIPIIEPEVDIHSPEKAQAEELLKKQLLQKLGELPAGQSIFLKLSIPTQDDLYLDFVHHPAVARVLALSGGYSRHEGNERLARNQGIIASFSRGLLEGLTAQQTDAEFNAELAEAVESIYQASTVKSAGK